MKRVALSIAIVLLTVSAKGQQPQQNRHEVSIWGGGGISSLQYKLSTGDHIVGTGGYVGLGYDYFFNYNWSLGAGAEFSALSGKAVFSMLQGSYLDRFEDSYLPGGGSALGRFSYETINRSYERQRAYYVNIPILAKYQFDLFKGHKFYAAAGPKIGIPVNEIYRSHGDLTTSGVELASDGTQNSRDPYINLPHHGFGTRRLKQSPDDLNNKVNIIASLEAGIKWRFKENKHWFMYTGLFADFGLNDIVKGNGDKSHFSNYWEYSDVQPGTTYDANSIFYSRNGSVEGANEVGKNFTNRVNTFAFGAKVRVTYGWKPFDKKERVKAVEEEKPYEGLTAAQMEDIMGRNTKALIDAQQKEFDELKDLLTEKEPDFLSATTGFDLGKYNLLVEMIPDLDRKVAVMKKYPKVNVVLEGHTDDYGSDKLNYQLGLDRANAVKDYLTQHGIASSRLSVTSKGAKNPAIPNANESSRRFNRRVEFILRQ
jgi:outer membrane protein OmpA-like peptidoglycan-associated protein